MKLNKLSIAALLLSAGVMAQVAPPTGTSISYTLSSDKSASGTMEVYYQNGNSRMEMEMKVAGAPIGPIKMTTIVQADKPKTSLSINETNKTYSEITSPPETEKKAEERQYVVTVIGKEKIGTYNCTHVKIKADKTDYEMWLTKELTATSEYYKSNNKYVGNENLQKALAEKQADGFPVKTVYNENRGPEGSITLLLTKFEKMIIPAEKFQVPAGYTKAAPGGVLPIAMPSQQEMMNMTPEERDKFIEQMKKQYATPPKGGN